MAAKIILTNKAQQIGEVSNSDIVSSALYLNRLVYQELRSLAKNKNIVDRVNAKNMPNELMTLFNSFDTLLKNGTADESVKILDGYLGSLGVTTEYIYTKDIINIPSWIEVDTQDPYRNVIHKDNSGVVYNVIHNDESEDFNVVHRTENLTIGAAYA